MPSIYYPDLRPKQKLLTLSGEEFHHMVRVARTRVGDSVKLNSGSGLMATARVLEIGKKEARLEVLETLEQSSFPSPFAIAFSLLKNKHDELLVEKCTELGAGHFFPLVGDFTVRKGNTESQGRLERIALAAIKQCDNPILPTLEKQRDLANGLKRVRELGYMPVLCSELRPDMWISDIELTEDTRPCFFIGPEGGWSEAELKLFQEEGITQISIGHLITRAETAAITVAAQWLAQANRLRATGTK